MKHHVGIVTLSFSLLLSGCSHHFQKAPLKASDRQIAQANSQIDIGPIREAKNEIRRIIRDINIEKIPGAVEAPEYRVAQLVLLDIMEQKQKEIEQYLSKVSKDFEDDYSVISNIRALGNSRATRSTVEDARERYRQRAESSTPTYQKNLREFITSGFDQAFDECLTVLCLNRVYEDVSSWMKITSKVNIDLDLGEKAKLRKDKSLRVKDIVRSMENSVEAKKKKLPLVLSRSSEEFHRLSDPSITREEAKLMGSRGIQKYGLEVIRNFTPEAISLFGMDDLAPGLGKHAVEDLNEYGNKLLDLYGVEAMEEVDFSPSVREKILKLNTSLAKLLSPKELLEMQSIRDRKILFWRIVNELRRHPDYKKKFIVGIKVNERWTRRSEYFSFYMNQSMTQLQLIFLEDHKVHEWLNIKSASDIENFEVTEGDSIRLKDSSCYYYLNRIKDLRDLPIWLQFSGSCGSSYYMNNIGGYVYLDR